MGGPNIPVKMKGVVQYFVSPMEQKVFGSMWKDSYKAIAKKIGDNIFDVAPALVYGFGLYYGGKYLNEQEKYHHRS
eukprot:CAMPEP_0196656870 /NCGR_PEP_ID=MMETSP1086-20130531/20023_1 /TAXON_ID=77921 /ORGANISM="Cyanoptyche  gloeocystis , Strain SAG4.97" /LENGTH=75 /DNA_ID=CAMNT_0041989779 /DNA_START=68 /DNA_END=295 /DNA_ORIENTATION=+